MKRAWITGMMLGISLLTGGCSTENNEKSAIQQEPEILETTLQEAEESMSGQEIEDTYGEMTEDFYLKIDYTFGLDEYVFDFDDSTDVVIFGISRNSPLYVNAKVDVITETGRIESYIKGVAVYREIVSGVEAESHVGVMLEGITSEDIQSGNIIVLRGCENPVEKMKQEIAEHISTILSTDYPEEKAYIPAYAKIIQQYETENDELGYDLIYLNEDELPELVVGREGYWVSVFTYAEGEVHTLMDDWGYGAMGNAGYEYIPRENVMRNYNTDYAGAVLKTTYFGMGDDQEIEIFVYLEMACFDEDGNRPSSDEEYQDAQWHFYVDEQEITEEEYDAYFIDGDYKYVIGAKTALEMLQEMEVGIEEQEEENLSELLD